jgi:hypothetical protein
MQGYAELLSVEFLGRIEMDFLYCIFTFSHPFTLGM